MARQSSSHFYVARWVARLPAGLTAAALVCTALGGPARAADAPSDSDLVKKGQYLATAGDCIACHTMPGGKLFAGGLPLATPVGAIISTNITPSKKDGIGNYTFEQFANAVRRGVAPDGVYLYPAMPYTAYEQLTDDDTKALYAYFMHGVEPVDGPTPRTNLSFPFDNRVLMRGWDAMFLNNKQFEPEPDKSAEWNRGAYLVKGLTHCGTCHTARNMMMAEENSRALGGASIGTWSAPNITSDVSSGIGGWSEQDIVDYLHTGHATNKAQAAGPMSEAVDKSLRYLTESDTRAIAIYLKGTPVVHDNGDTRPPFQWGVPGNDLAAVRGTAWPANPDQLSGPQLYDAHCATCHQSNGEGRDKGGLPSLFYNTALGRRNTDNLVMVILDGIGHQADMPDMLMPGFRNELSDQQITTLSSYLTKQYGNPDAKVKASQVADLRAGKSATHAWTPW
jgi:mono/diheme cytochrome c family protein